MRGALWKILLYSVEYVCRCYKLSLFPDIPRKYLAGLIFFPDCSCGSFDSFSAISSPIPCPHRIKPMTLRAGCPFPEQGLSDFFVQSLKVLFAGRTVFCDVTELNGLDAGIENAVDFLHKAGSIRVVSPATTTPSKSFSFSAAIASVRSS